MPWLEIALGAADADNLPGHAGFDTAFDGADSITGYLELVLRSPWESEGLPGSGSAVRSTEAGANSGAHGCHHASPVPTKSATIAAATM